MLIKVHSEAPQGLWLRQGWVRGGDPRGGQDHHQKQVTMFETQTETSLVDGHC